MHDRIRAILQTAGIDYQVHLHAQFSVPIRSPQDFAQALGYDLSRISKTLLLQATDRQTFGLAVISSDRRLNFDRVAEVLQCKRVRMADRPTLAELLTYPPTGVSPLGAGSIPVLLDEGLQTWPTILIGAGEVGVEIELSPAALQELTQGTWLALADEN